MVAGQREAVDTWVTEIMWTLLQDPPVHAHRKVTKHMCIHCTGTIPHDATRRCNNHQGIHVRLWE